MTSGIFEYIDANTYHQDFLGDPRASETPSLSASIAHLLLSRSPAHAKHAHPRLNENYQREADPKFDVGTAVHDILLNGNQNVVVIEHDSYRTNAAKEAREFARTKLMTPLLTHEYERALEMCEAVLGQLAEMPGYGDGAPIPFMEGKSEVTLLWHEPNGVACRMRADHITDDHRWIHDLKTTSRSARGEDWTRGPLYDHGCDLQAAFYRRGVEALTGVRPEWRWVVVETSPPYALQVIRPGNDVFALGDAKVERALAIWAECLEHDEWPAYSAEVFEAEVPAFQEMRWMEWEARAA